MTCQESISCSEERRVARSLIFQKMTLNLNFVLWGRKGPQHICRTRFTLRILIVFVFCFTLNKEQKLCVSVLPVTIWTGWRACPGVPTVKRTCYWREQKRFWKKTIMGWMTSRNAYWSANAHTTFRMTRIEKLLVYSDGKCSHKSISSWKTAHFFLVEMSLNSSLSLCRNSSQWVSCVAPPRGRSCVSMVLRV